MAIGDEIRKSFASDGATYNGGVQLRQIGAADAEALYSVLTNKKIARPTAVNKTAVDSTVDLTSATYTAGKINIGQSMHVMVDVEFTSSTGSITVFLAKYDTLGNYCGPTPPISFTAMGYRNGAAGKYGCNEVQPFEVGNASYVYPVVSAFSDTSVDIYVTAL